MKITAIISEFNPFHKGHKHLIDKARENGATHIIAVMSGNFVQRGEGAVFSKWDRAETALENGVDLVIENSLIFATSSAQRFAFGGVGVINGLGCVDEIAFGSESGDVEKLESVAEVIADNEFAEEIQKYLKDGLSFPKAREKAIKEKYCEEYGEILSSPNNILACEYISECRKANLDINFFTVPRIGAGHDSDIENNGFSSASYLRELMKIDVASTDEIFETTRKKCKGFDFTKMELSILVKLRNFTTDDFADLPDVTEGMENRLYSAAQKAVSLSEFYEFVKTKRYTHSRIRRICLYAFLGITKEDVSVDVPYLRVIGLNDKGREILKIAKDTASLPIVMKYSDVKSLDTIARKVFDIESKATDIFALSGEEIFPCGLEKTENVIIKKSEKN